MATAGAGENLVGIAMGPLLSETTELRTAGMSAAAGRFQPRRNQVRTDSLRAGIKNKIAKAGRRPTGWGCNGVTSAENALCQRGISSVVAEQVSYTKRGGHASGFTPHAAACVRFRTRERCPWFKNKRFTTKAGSTNRLTYNL